MEQSDFDKDDSWNCFYLPKIFAENIIKKQKKSYSKLKNLVMWSL